MKNMKLMLVDDEERFLETTSKLLTKKGIDVITATSGSSALEQLFVRSDIHVVILDVKMPGMDGIETLKQIKANYPLVEVIMLTGHGTMDSAIDGLKSGATDYLLKPADIDDLILCAKAAYEKRQLLEEKIRMAQNRSFMKSPREIIKQSYSE